MQNVGSLHIVSLESFKEQVRRGTSSYLVAKDGNQVIAYIKYDLEAENFISNHDRVINICGAYLEADYRGQGIFQNLLYTTLHHMKSQGYQLCGVDFETLNPEALHFWTKYFTPYTYSLTRRIDERNHLMHNTL